MTSGPSLDLLVPASFAVLFLALWGAAYAAIPGLLRSIRAVAGLVAAWLREHAGMTAIVVVAAVVLTARRRFRWMAYLAITVTGGTLLDELLKAHFTRQRPDLSGAILGADGDSFPSGHAMNGTVILCAIGYLAAHAALTWKSKSAVFAALVTLDLAIAASRLYLGVHWTTDVIVGLAAGLLWVTATTTGYELVRLYLERGARERATAATPEAGSRPPASS